MTKRIAERAMTGVFFITALTSIVAVALICIFLFSRGVPVIGEIGVLDFIFGRKWAPDDVPAYFGIFPMIMASIYVTGGAIALGVPVGILTAVYMARMCPPRLYRVLKPALELLAGIPSVVYGFFGMTVLVPLLRNWFGGSGKSMLAASVLLAIMILPTVIGISEAALRAVPENYYEGALALGADRNRAVYAVQLPAASSGVMTAVVLGIGRAFGETMAVTLVAGNQAIMPSSLFFGVRTLTTNIVLEMGYALDYPSLHRASLIATGVVLFVFVMIINTCASVIKRRVGKNNE